MQVKPTRMELSNLKKRRTVAVRGHKMMKDKRDELVRRFIVLARRNKDLRIEVEKGLSVAMQSFVLARAMMSNSEIEEALMYPARAIAVEAEKQSILSIPVPKLSMEAQEGFVYPYGFVTTGADLDVAVQSLAEVLPLMLELAETEKACSRLADEIEKTRRRVNALEYVMIPQFDDAIGRIQMKLEENERGNLTRLMKTKDMLANK
ncbi:MAG: V-type ATP synthase subunit D [Eubacteriales bacterium]|nr:V-type ATP synthase subunit D [Eubacteriales bacterium]